DLRFLNVKGFQRDFITHLLLLGTFYLNYFIFIPKFYFRKKHISFALLLILSCSLVYVSREIFLPHEFHHHHTHEHHKFENHPHQNKNFAFSIYLHIGRDLLSFSIAIILPLMLRIASKWKQAEKEKINTELSFLKAQINPHFLFNSLNSIYAMSIGEHAEKSSNAVQKLSEMMRYVLEESEHEFVTLDKEINYLKNYIELQKLRFGNTIQIHFLIEGQTQHKNIAPLILIPFIENAFKFGVSPEVKSELEIHISFTNESLNLRVRNDKLRINFNETERHGIGMKNTKTRLELLYPGKHNLNIEETQKDFKVNLILQLS
ncbi:MAG: sensor histidine kinase, partial [Bacteroidota bacterium]